MAKSDVKPDNKSEKVEAKPEAEVEKAIAPAAAAAAPAAGNGKNVHIEELKEMKMPELLQYDATPEKISKTAATILGDEKRSAQMREDLGKVSLRLGEPGASKRAAEEILKVLGEKAKEPAGIRSVRSS